MLLALVAVVFSVSVSFAQDATDDMKSKLSSVRSEKSGLTGTYERDIQKLTAEYDAKLEDIRKDFHAKRDACLKEQESKKSGITSTYKEKLRPLTDEEKKLIEMGAIGSNNFAKKEHQKQ